MNIKKLLTTTAIAAAAATSAHATLTVDYSATPAATVSAIPTIASELDLSNTTGTPLTSTFGFQAAFTTADTGGAGNFLLTINLPAGVTFSQNILSSTLATDFPNNIDTVANNGDDYGAIAIQSGGGAGSQQVVLVVTTIGATNQINMKLPLNIGPDACSSPAPISISFVNQLTNAGVGGGSASASDNVVLCSSAFNSSGTGLGVAAGTPDLLGVASGYTLFKTAPGTSATLGTINASIDATPQDDVAGGGSLVAGDVAKAEFSVDFVDATGIDSVTVDFGGSTTQTVSTPVGNSFPFVVTTNLGKLLDGTADSIKVNVGGGTGTLPVIKEQAVSVGSSTLTFNATSTASTQNLISSEAFASGALGSITRDGQSFGPFDWVGDASKASRNIFRFTGAVADSTEGEVTFSNSSTGANGTFPLTLTTANGEGQVDSIALDALNPGFGRADVKFFFFSPGPADVDRLMLRGDVLSTFGGGANTTAGSDD